MISQLNADGLSAISSGKGLDFSNIGKAVAQQTAMHGYGAISNTDVGKVVTTAHDISQTIKAFAYFDIKEDAKHGAFAVFRDAMAEKAENYTQGIIPNVKDVTNGDSYTNFYSDILSAQRTFENELLTSSPNSIEAQLDYSTVDWNSFASRTRYLDKIQDYAKNTALRDHAGMVGNSLQAKQLQASAMEIKVLFHTSSPEEYEKYINTFEHAIHNNYQQELKNAQEQARALGYTGSLSNVKAMEKFKETLPVGSQGVMSNLIEMTNGNINKVDRYILARIHNGDIDIQKVLSTGELNGVKLDEASLKAFAALNVFAHTDAIATEYQNNILKGIGYESKLKNVDLNNIKDVTARIQEFEKALEKAGYGAVDLKKSSLLGSAAKGVPLSKLSLNQLRKIDLKGIKDEAVKKALTQYINLKDHAQTLKAAKMLKGKLISRGISLVRKVLGDSDLSQGIGQIYSQIHNAKTAIKVGQRIVKFAKWTKGTKLAKGLKAAARFQHKINQKALKKILGKRYDAFNKSRFGDKGKQIRNRAKSIKNAKQQAQRTKLKEAKKAAKKLTKKGQKHAAKLAKKTQSKLFGKVGTQAGKWARGAGKLAAHGVAGTTGAGAAGVGVAGAGTSAGAGAAGAGTSASAGAGAAGGTSVMTVIFWVILIALLISLAGRLIATVCSVIAGSAASLNDTLLGDILNWFSDWSWPWDDSADEEDIENVFWFTLHTLDDLEIKSQSVKDLLNENAVFRGGVAPCEKDTHDDPQPKYITEDKYPSEVSWYRSQYKVKDIPDNPETYYVYTNRETGEPINEYTSIKLCISMAHAFTYQIETKQQVRDYTNYAIGLWKYLNQHTVTGVLKMCEYGCGTYTYNCHILTLDDDEEDKFDSAYYQEARGWGWIYETAPGAQIEVTAKQYDPDEDYYDFRDYKFYIIKGKPTDKTAHGCLKTTHNNRTGQITVEDLHHLGRDQTIMSVTKKRSEINPQYIGISKSNSNYLGPDGKAITWRADPKVIQECAEQTSFPNITFCMSSLNSPIIKCDNQEVKDIYTKSTKVKYCGTSYMLNTASGQKQQVYLTNESVCKSQHTHQELPGGNHYKCNGHSTPVYCEGYGKITYYTGYTKSLFSYIGTNAVTAQHASYVSCGCESEKTLQVYRSSLSFKKPSKVTLYICNGHNNHGTFNESSGYVDSCDNKTLIGNVYQCTGYNETIYVNSGKKLYVCKGHEVCDGHYKCPGHTLTYCKGHISYKIERKSIMTTSDAIYSDSWTYTETTKYWFLELSTIYTPKKKKDAGGNTSLARNDWAGWTEDNKELMFTLYNADWYFDYNVGLQKFVGGQCSPHEKSVIFETFKITPDTVPEPLLKNINFALDSCGMVSYYPGDKAVAAGMDPQNKFGTPAPVIWDKNKVQRGVHGLDPQYFADWVYRSTHDNNSSNYLVSYYAGNGYQVTATTLPGTPIVNNTPGNIRTGILLGVYTDDKGITTVRYVGIDTGDAHGGWVTIINEPISGWKYTTATCS